MKSASYLHHVSQHFRATAEGSIIFNNTGTTAIQSMGVTTYVPIPAVSVGQTDGTALRDFIAAHPETTARLRLTPAVYPFTVTDTLVCEHVGVRLKTTHTSRSDVRVTLVSPIRVGFEDNVFFSKGVLAKSNAELVERAARISHEAGLKPATPDEVRQYLKLRG